MTIEAFYGQSIGVQAPWKVASVSIKGDLKEVHIRVECPKGTVWADPETRERATVKDYQERTWRHLDTCEFTTIVSAPVPRVTLKSGRTMMVEVPWAERGGRFTRRFESRLIELLDEARTVRAAARLAKVTEDQMDGVMSRAVARGEARRELGDVTALGLDEKAYRAGHKYVTVLNDLNNVRVLDVVENRTEEAAKAALKTLPAEMLRKVESVAMDMWQPYRTAVESEAPQAVIVYDHFHVSGHLNKAVDEVRRGERGGQAKQGDDTLAGTKYLWLRSRLDLRTKAGIEFRKLLNSDLKTAEAWALKENFQRFWCFKSWSRAWTFLEKWVEAARDTGLKPMAKAADMIDKHAEGLLNYIHFPITNAASECLNLAIQNLKAAARGLPKFTSLRSRILFFLGKLDRHPA